MMDIHSKFRTCRFNHPEDVAKRNVGAPNVPMLTKKEPTSEDEQVITYWLGQIFENSRNKDLPSKGIVVVAEKVVKLKMAQIALPNCP